MLIKNAVDSGDSAGASEERKREEVREYWNNHIHDWKVAKSAAGTKDFFLEIEEYRFEKLHYLPKLVDFDGYMGQRVLDVGCGVGNDLSRFARGGANVVGIDLAEHSIELAKKNFKLRELSGDFFLMDGENMSFEDNSFDLVYCHTVIHFTVNPEKMVAEIFRVLKPGGTAIIMTVNRYSWLNVLHKLMRVEIDHLDAPIFNKYSKRQFGRMLRQFNSCQLVAERFPVKTKVHHGIKAIVYNAIFVGSFNLLPKPLTRRAGHHLLAFAQKNSVPPDSA